MSVIYSILGYPLGWIMWLCYQITHNYGIALLIFTVISRCILIPFTIKQQKTSAQMATLKPQLDELQKKYANNKQKLQEEMMSLYNKVGYNPMSGCLPLLIQMPILFGLIDVIYKPLTHILHLPSDMIEAGKQIAIAGGADPKSWSIQLDIMRGILENPAQYSSLGAETLAQIETLKLNFLGMDLTLRPSMDMLTSVFQDFNPIILIPILSGATAMLMSVISMRNNSASMEGQAAASMKGMMLTMPIFSLVFTFSVPAGVGLYWIYSNLVGTIQSIILNKVYNPKEMAEKMRLENQEREEKERLERIEAKKLAKEGLLEDDEKALSQKELNRRKLAAARKRDAEKYGEEIATDNTEG